MIVPNGKTINVLIADQADELLLNKLKEMGLNVDYLPNITREKILERIGDYEILIVRSRTKVDKTLISKAKRLKIVVRAGTGIDNIDIEELSKKGVKLIYSPGSSTTSVVELVLGLMIMSARSLHRAISSVKKGEWKKIEGEELCCKTLGIIGLGRIGVKLAIIAKALNMKVLAYDIIDIGKKVDILGIEETTLENLLRESDFISVHVNINKDAKPIIGDREVGLIKNGAIIINTSRGKAIDTAALLKAIKERRIKAVALDVLENEPPTEKEMELINMENVIVTPHIGAQTLEAQRRIAESIARKLIEEVKEMVKYEATVNTRPS